MSWALGTADGHLACGEGMSFSLARTELTALLALLAALLIVAGSSLSFLWFGRIA